MNLYENCKIKFQFMKIMKNYAVFSVFPRTRPYILSILFSDTINLSYLNLHKIA
jgi:hypothetical protein